MLGQTLHCWAKPSVAGPNPPLLGQTLHRCVVPSIAASYPLPLGHIPLRCVVPSAVSVVTRRCCRVYRVASYPIVVSCRTLLLRCLSSFLPLPLLLISSPTHPRLALTRPVVNSHPVLSIRFDSSPWSVSRRRALVVRFSWLGSRRRGSPPPPPPPRRGSPPPPPPPRRRRRRLAGPHRRRLVSPCGSELVRRSSSSFVPSFVVLAFCSLPPLLSARNNFRSHIPLRRGGAVLVF